MKKRILLYSIVIFFVMVPFVFAQGKAEKTGPTYTVANVLSSKAKKVQKYIFKDIRKGVEAINSNINIEQSFITYDNVKDSVFTEYDVVIVHSTGRTDTLDPQIIDFVQKHKDNENVIVTAYLPNNKSILTSPPKGVDVISSASDEDPAAALLIDTVSPIIVDIASKL